MKLWAISHCEHDGSSTETKVLPDLYTSQASAQKTLEMLKELHSPLKITVHELELQMTNEIAQLFCDCRTCRNLRLSRSAEARL